MPDDVEAALARLGLRATTALGHDRWLAVALDGSGNRLELQTLDADVRDDALVARVERLRGVRHDHLARLLDATEVAPGRLGLVVEHVEGLSLAQIRAARAPLTDGEAATVAIPVAGALGALHDASLAHGAVDASTIQVRADGRPLLRDLRSVVSGAGSAVEDLAALAAAVIAQLPGDEVHLLAGGLALRDALLEALAHPAVDAGCVVDACFGAADPEPVLLPDAGSLASSALLSSARHAPPLRTRRSARRRLPVRLVVLASVAVLAFGAVGWRLLGGPAEPVSALTDPHDPVAAAVELSALRTAVVGDADPGRLGEVEIPDGPAHTADVDLLASLDPGGAGGLAVDVRDAWLIPDAGARGSTTDVAVTAAMSSTAGEAAPRTVVLGLRWTDDGWRVWDVTEDVD